MQIVTKLMNSVYDFVVAQYPLKFAWATWFWLLVAQVGNQEI